MASRKLREFILMNCPLRSKMISIRRKKRLPSMNSLSIRNLIRKKVKKSSILYLRNILGRIRL